MIKTVKEPVGLGLTEVCIFCGNPTTYWNLDFNVPVCNGCKKLHTIYELEELVLDINDMVSDKHKIGTQKSPFGIGS